MDNITEKIRLNHDKLYRDNTLTAIKVTGKDNKKFLQGQLTNDMENLSDKYVHASYCTHQGKVIVNVQAFLCDDEIILLLTKTLSKYFLEKISKYILMADVKFTEYDDITVLWGLGDKALKLIEEHKIDSDKSFNKISQSEYVINMTNDKKHQIRYIDLDSIACKKIEYETLAESQTCLIDLFSMHTRLKERNIEKFIPQVLNSDQLNTVNYKKGCYTGQEVIARTHYLGNVKKHTYLVSVDSSINDESNIVNSDGESVGELIGETFEFDNILLSHCILRDSCDFDNLLVNDKDVQVLIKEDIS